MRKAHRLLSLVLAAAVALSLAALPAAAQGNVRPQITVQYWQNSVEVEGKTAYFRRDEDVEHQNALFYDDMVYIPLRSAGKWMGMEARWDESARTLDFTKTEEGPKLPAVERMPDRPEPSQEVLDELEWARIHGATAQLLTDISVTVEGKVQTFLNAQGERLYPILYRDYVYLPIDSVAGLCGMACLWVPVDKDITDIWIYAPLTQEDFAQFDGYCAEMTRLQGELRAGLDALEAREDLTEETFLDEIRALRAIGQQMLDLPLPDRQGAFFKTEQIWFASSYVPEDDCDDFLVRGRTWHKNPWQEDMIRFLDNAERHIDRVDECIVTAQEQAAAMAQAAGMPEWTAATQAVQAQAEAKQRQLDTAARFTDAAQIQNWDAVATLAALGIFTGKSDGSFDPAAPVTRAEMAKLAYTMRCANEGIRVPRSVRKGNVQCTFTDTAGHWARGYIEQCASIGYLDGRGNGIFDPDATVTTAEAAKIALVLLFHTPGAFGLTGEKWKENTVTIATEKELFNGLDISRLDQPMTRDEVAQLLYNVLSARPVTYDQGTFRDNELPYWTQGWPAPIPTQPAN